MSEYGKIKKQLIADFADQIRRLASSEDTMTPPEMLELLKNMDFSLQEKSVTLDSIGQSVTPDDGAYGMSKVDVGAIAHVNGYFSAILQSDIALTKTATVYPLALRMQYGNYFEVVDGAIVCKKSCTAEVYGQIYMYEGFGSGDSVTARLLVNAGGTDPILQINRIAANSNAYEQVASGPVVVEFAVGDTITIDIRNATNARGTLLNYYTHSFVYLKVIG